MLHLGIEEWKCPNWWPEQVVQILVFFKLMFHYTVINAGIGESLSRTLIIKLFTFSFWQHNHDGNNSTAIIWQLVCLWTLLCHRDGNFTLFFYKQMGWNVEKTNSESRKTKFDSRMKNVVSVVVNFMWFELQNRFNPFFTEHVTEKV